MSLHSLPKTCRKQEQLFRLPFKALARFLWLCFQLLVRQLMGPSICKRTVLFSLSGTWSASALETAQGWSSHTAQGEFGTFWVCHPWPLPASEPGRLRVGAVSSASPCVPGWEGKCRAVLAAAVVWALQRGSAREGLCSNNAGSRLAPSGNVLPQQFLAFICKSVGSGSSHQAGELAQGSPQGL